MNRVSTLVAVRHRVEFNSKLRSTTIKKRILIALPLRDFDPTEVCIPWDICREAGHTVIFATETGERGYADKLMISGRELDPWGFIPLLKSITLVGRFLRAQKTARDTYRRIQEEASFLNPETFTSLPVEDYDAVIFPGGHASGMKPYLESKVLQDFTVAAFDRGEGKGGPIVIAAICHGVVVLARSRSHITGKSVLHGRKTTALTWEMEKTAAKITRYTRFWDPSY